MTLHAITQIMPFDYIPKQDRDSDTKTIFKLRPLNGLQHMEVLREIDDENRYTTAAIRLAIKYGLTGWENFTDESGHAIPYSPVTIARLPPFVLHELGMEIITRSELGEPARKNS